MVPWAAVSGPGCDRWDQQSRQHPSEATLEVDVEIRELEPATRVMHEVQWEQQSRDVEREGTPVLSVLGRQPASWETVL